MNTKNKNIIHAILAIVMFVLLVVADNTNFVIPAYVVFFAYFVYLGKIMFACSDALIKKVDSIGTWDEIRCMIYELNPKEKIPTKHSSQRYMWLARKKYDFGDEELSMLEREYTPNAIIFYALLIAFVFKLAI